MNIYNEFDKPKDLRPNTDYNTYKAKELKGFHSDFNYAEIMREASVNEKWKAKERIMDFIISCL